jgi:hypothetical protein
MTRILECVPKFLTDEKKFYLLKCEIMYYLDVLHHKQQNTVKELTGINKAFEKYAEEINNFSQINMPWFVKGVFEENEIQQFLAVCRYALTKKLNLAHEQIFNDLILIKNKCENIKAVKLVMRYKIDFLCSTIQINKTDEISFEKYKARPNNIAIDGKYKKYTEKYILEELMKMNFTQQEGEVNHLLKKQDLDYYIHKCEQMLQNDGEALFNAEFQGEGGRFYISAEVKSFKRIQELINFSIIKLTLYGAIIFLAIILISVFGLGKILGYAIFGFIIGGSALYNGITTEYKNYKLLNDYLRIYGKQ